MTDAKTEPMIHEDALPGSEATLEPRPEWEPRYKGSNRLHDKVAPSFLFLACDDASYMTGQILHPNGGTIVGG